MDRKRPHITRRQGSLTVGGVDLEELARAFGTPSYVTDLDRIADLYGEADGALKARHGDSLIAFAMKSNPTPAILGALAERGAGATVVSMAGIQLALKSGVKAADIVFDGPSKSKEEIQSAVAAGIGMINAESTQEVLDIESICRESGTKGCRVGFRVNLGIRAKTHAGLATGAPEHKFGVPRREAVAFCRGVGRELEGARIVGLHSHIGSQISDPGVFEEVTEGLVGLSEEVEDATGEAVEEVNFGGGLGYPYQPRQRGISFQTYAEATAGRFEELRGSTAKRTRLVFELGRSLVADSTLLLTRVNYVKRSGGRTWALVDAGMNDFLRPALYGAYHEVVPVKTRRERSSAAYDIGGPVCETTDVFATRRRLGSKLSRGELLAVLDAGAYGISMASWYNMRAIPPVVTVSGGRSTLASPRVPYPTV